MEKTANNIMTIASELYVWNCEHDNQFNTLSNSSIAACIRVDLKEKIGRSLTGSEEDMVDEVLAIFIGT